MGLKKETIGIQSALKKVFKNKLLSDYIFSFKNVNELWVFVYWNCLDDSEFQDIIELQDINGLKDFFGKQLVFLNDKIYFIMLQDLASNICAIIDERKEELIKLLARELKQDIYNQDTFKFEDMTYEYYYYYDDITLKKSLDLIKVDYKNKTRKLNSFEILYICSNLDKIITIKK